MRISIRFDGYPLYAFVPEWMVMAYVVIAWSWAIIAKAKFDALGEV